MCFFSTRTDDFWVFRHSFTMVLQRPLHFLTLARHCFTFGWLVVLHLLRNSCYMFLVLPLTLVFPIVANSADCHSQPHIFLYLYLYTYANCICIQIKIQIQTQAPVFPIVANSTDCHSHTFLLMITLLASLDAFLGGQVVRSSAFSKLAAHIPIYTLEQLKSDNNGDCGRPLFLRMYPKSLESP